MSSVNRVTDKNESYKNIYVCICNWKNIICVWINSEMLTNRLNVPKAPTKPKHAQCITIFADASANTHTQWENTHIHVVTLFARLQIFLMTFSQHCGKIPDGWSLKYLRSMFALKEIVHPKILILSPFTHVVPNLCHTLFCRIQKEKFWGMSWSVVSVQWQWWWRLKKGCKITF